MLTIITVYQFLELIIKLSIHMTGHNVTNVEYHYVFLSIMYPVSDAWIVRIELKFNILQVYTKFPIEK